MILRVGTLKLNTKGVSSLEVDSTGFTLEENSRAAARDWSGFKSWD